MIKSPEIPQADQYLPYQSQATNNDVLHSGTNNAAATQPALENEITPNTEMTQPNSIVLIPAINQENQTLNFKPASSENPTVAPQATKPRIRRSGYPDDINLGRPVQHTVDVWLEPATTNPVTNRRARATRATVDRLRMTPDPNITLSTLGKELKDSLPTIPLPSRKETITGLGIAATIFGATFINRATAFASYTKETQIHSTEKPHKITHTTKIEIHKGDTEDEIAAILAKEYKLPIETVLKEIKVENPQVNPRDLKIDSFLTVPLEPKTTTPSIEAITRPKFTGDIAVVRFRDTFWAFAITESKETGVPIKKEEAILEALNPEDSPCDLRIGSTMILDSRVPTNEVPKPSHTIHLAQPTHKEPSYKKQLQKTINEISNQVSTLPNDIPEPPAVVAYNANVEPILVQPVPVPNTAPIVVETLPPPQIDTETTPPPIIPAPLNTPILEINSNPNGDQSTAGSVFSHDLSVDALSPNVHVQNGSSHIPSTSTPQALSGSNPMLPMVDASGSHPNPEEEAQQGIRGEFRYLGHAGEGKKLLTKAEADQIHAAGEPIGIVYEAGAEDALGGYDAGIRAGRTALAKALELGIPLDTTLFFAADWNVTNEQLPIVNDFLRGAQSAIGAYKAGIYGGFKVVKSALDSGVVVWAWQTYAWSHNEWDKRAQFRQVKNDVLVAGAIVDRDKGRSTKGMWLPPKLPHSSTTSHSTKVPARNPTANDITSGNSKPESTHFNTNTQIYDYFINNGLTSAAAAGITANANAESGSQPQRLEGTPSGEKISVGALTANQLNNPELGYGIFQFTPAEKFVSWAYENNLDPNDLNAQCKYVLDGMDANLRQELNEAPNASVAAKIFEKFYERPSSLSDAPRREHIAQTIFSHMNSPTSKFSALTR